ncbi:MAG: MBL fold metallo-hydrolase [Xanthobacteraceae bacterium]|nr:MBL fold metallo-hydrolase [Xanthobacteraceae bacterium]
MKRPAAIAALALLVPFSTATAQTCDVGPVAVQILGSGGPAINRFRSSSSYLLRIDGQSKVLIDMGGGAFGRFGQAEARLADLAMVGISHLHPDHVSDLPALLWLSHNSRKEPLPIVGPSGNNAAPDFKTFLSRLFDEKTGAFQLLGPVLGAKQGPTGGGVLLDVTVVDVTKAEATTVHDKDGLTVTAFGIPHGPMATLAYRATTRGVSVVFSSDQTGTDPKFIDFAKGANVLIMHLAIPAGAKSPLHAAPEVVGRVAKEAGIGHLIVSHVGPFNLEPAIAELKTAYTGPLTIGADLQCTAAK